MNRPTAFAIAWCAVAAACSDDVAPAHNPDKLWLALDGTEVQVKLVASEPQPF
jgi:hypothetical protein